MAGKRELQQQSSFSEYLDALHKIDPQLKTLLSHISSITGNTSQTNQLADTLTTKNSNLHNVTSTSDTCAGAPRVRSRCTTAIRKPCTPRRRNGMASNEQQIQAVTNTGKIVYGVVNEDGKLEVKGHVGEIKEDLLGLELDVVNAGRKTRTRKTSSRKKCMMQQNHQIMP
ncbi:virion protein [Turkeypox virus]|uniref:25 kDa core protein OPG138 n=1 Tax=Turkeypox virus TaxID=336486 RepID=A0A0M3ZCU3_9POXV|nr:virion protein [Turkeypox virus]ALA62504.1 virion protein [Turkeypox virus]